MIALIVFHLCGIGRVVRSIAWSLLVLWCVYTSWVVVFSSTAHAQSSTVIYDTLTALEVLQYHNSYGSLFGGNNAIVFNVLKEKYRTSDSIESFKKFTVAFDWLSSQQRDSYRIDKESVMTVLEAVVLVVQRTSVSSNNSINLLSTSSHSLPYGYGIKTYTKEEWMLVTFETNQTILPKRMNRHFGDWTQYSCERDQCRRFNHMYEDIWKYTIDIYSSMRMHEHEKKKITLMVE